MVNVTCCAVQGVAIRQHSCLHIAHLGLQFTHGSAEISGGAGLGAQAPHPAYEAQCVIGPEDAAERQASSAALGSSSVRIMVEALMASVSTWLTEA